MIFSTVGLGVADLQRALRFYTAGLGFEVDSEPMDELVYLASGSTRIALYPADRLADYAGTELRTGSSVVLGLNVDREADVDTIMARACTQGGTLLRPATRMEWGGYAGTLTDPDGHVWEIVYSAQSRANS